MSDAQRKARELADAMDLLEHQNCDESCTMKWAEQQQIIALAQFLEAYGSEQRKLGREEGLEEAASIFDDREDFFMGAHIRALKEGAKP